VEVAVSVPAHIADRVAEALDALYRRPDQTLLAWYRYAIYQALVADRSRASYAARAWIDLLSVQHVLFCWQPYARAGWHATWLQPNDLLGLAEQILCGTADAAVVQRQITRAEALADVVGEPAASARYAEWCVFEAALRALRSAWSYQLCCTTPAQPNSWDAGGVALDDASGYAAIAVAGRLSPAHSDPLPLTGHSSPAARREADDVQLRRTFFWEWWLREAIPQAWQRR
jgi:hypothetical protein